jgi:PPOX class F420-dependent enzyme/OxyR family protein
MGAFSQREFEYLREQELGRIATVSKKQLPQVTPVAFGVDEDRLYVNIKHTSQKARNIKGNPKVSFLVDDASPWGKEDVFIRGVLVSGEAELVSSGVLHKNGRDLIEEKYPGYEKLYGIREDGWSKYILVIIPTKVRSWGLT